MTELRYDEEATNRLLAAYVMPDVVAQREQFLRANGFLVSWAPPSARMRLVTATPLGSFHVSAPVLVELRDPARDLADVRRLRAAPFHGPVVGAEQMIFPVRLSSREGEATPVLPLAAGGIAGLCLHPTGQPASIEGEAENGQSALSVALGKQDCALQIRGAAR
jgi:hypothetical protein